MRSVLFWDFTWPRVVNTAPTFRDNPSLPSRVHCTKINELRHSGVQSQCVLAAQDTKGSETFHCIAAKSPKSCKTHIRESQYYQQWWIWLNSASILDFTLSSDALRKERYVLVTTPNCRVLAESTRSVYNELEMLVFKSTHNFAIHQISYMFRLSFCIHHQGDPKNCIITFHIL